MSNPGRARPGSAWQSAEARRRRERWQTLKRSVAERGLNRTERLALVDAYLADEPAGSPFREDAEALRLQVDRGSNTTLTDGFHLNYVVPAGVRIEVGRFRWPTFQLSVFQGTYSAANLATTSLPDDSDYNPDFARLGFGETDVRFGLERREHRGLPRLL